MALGPSGGEGIYAKFSVVVDGRELTDFAVMATANMDDLRPVFTVIAENLRRLASQAFKSEGKALGAAWSPLAARTVEARRRGWGYYRAQSTEGPSHRVLQWRHVLRDSMTDVGAPGHIELMTPNVMTFGTNVPYAAAVNKLRPFNTLPADFVKTDIAAPIGQYLTDRDPRVGQGKRSTRRAGSALLPIGSGVAA